MQEKFNQLKYQQEFNKKNYRTFKVDLKKEEKEEVDKLLNLMNASKADFLRNAIKNLKEELKMSKFYVVARTQSFEKRGNWINRGDVTYGHIDTDKIFDNIDDARKYYDSIKLTDDIQGNNRYSDYKELYQIDSTIDNIDDIVLDNAKLIINEYLFTDYE